MITVSDTLCTRLSHFKVTIPILSLCTPVLTISREVFFFAPYSLFSGLRANWLQDRLYLGETEDDYQSGSTSLTIPQCRTWTWVSTLFVIVRIQPRAHGTLLHIFQN